MPKKTATKTKEKPQEFAVVETGGKQYKVSVGDKVKIEKIIGDHKEGDTITFDKVLMVDDGSNTSIGVPYVDGAKVEAKLVKIGRHDKVIVLKYKAKSRYLKKNGHRQPYFEVEISKIK
jgi:large subunit ribosomal protein L21